MTDADSRYQVVGLAILVEGGLILVAEAFGRLVGRPPVPLIHWDGAGLLAGLAATLPMLALFLAIVRWPRGPFAGIERFTREVLCPLLEPCTTVDLLGISCLAGLGEELLFRGVLQATLQDWLTPGWGLVIASGIFGLLHAVTLIYAVLAALLGAYLGALWWYTDNLLAPIVAHAVYDFLVLLYLMREQSRRREQAELK